MADVEVRVVDAEGGLMIVERAVQREVLLHARALIKPEAAAERSAT